MINIEQNKLNPDTLNTVLQSLKTFGSEFMILYV